MKSDLPIRALKRAAELKGGADKLATHLGVPHSTLQLWLTDKATLPQQIFDKVIDVMLEDDIAALKGTPPPAPAKAPPRVLVVDDDVSGAYGLARVIQQLGYPVETASDGPTAMESARRFRPEVIFLDLRMPGMDGVEIARLLKAEGLGSHIVAATAYQSELDRTRTVSAGFDAQVLKPLDAASLEKLLTGLR
jgi:CheY-like chemotaxis protein